MRMGCNISVKIEHNIWVSMEPFAMRCTVKTVTYEAICHVAVVVKITVEYTAASEINVSDLEFVEWLSFCVRKFASRDDSIGVNCVDDLKVAEYLFFTCVNFY
jgi:hypothetical protein